MNFVHHEGLNIPSAERIDTPEGRRYVSPRTGEKYISVTTLLNSGDKSWLKKWEKRVGKEEADRITRVASSRGTGLHTICERYLNNEEQPTLGVTDYNSISYFNIIKKELDKNVGLIYAIEQPLFSDTLKLAGTPDLICEWKGKPAIIDFKNSMKLKKKEWITNYFVQTTAYSIMFEELTGIPCKDLVIIIGTEGEPLPQIWNEKRANWYPNLAEFLNNYKKSLE